MSLFSVTLLFLFSLAGAKFLCASPTEFQTSNPALHTKEFSNQKEGKAIPLHRFLFEKGKKLGEGAYGTVKAAAGIEPKLVIKKVESNDPTVLDAMEREIAILKKLCGKNPEKTYTDLFECDSTVIAGFKGCVEEENSVYIFQEHMTMDLDNSDAKSKYQALSGGRKAQLMVDIIRKFQKIHDKGIVHSDIKPANIMMKTNDFSDLRVVDFGMSGKKGTKSIGGSRLCLPPEQHWSNYLTIQGDIYSLGITFALMEKSAFNAIKGMNEACFNQTPDQSCRSKLDKALEKAFDRSKKTESLLNVFLKATNYNPDKRYRSMSQFAEAITFVAQNLPGFGNNPEEVPKGLFDRFLNFIGYGDGNTNRILTSETIRSQRNSLII